MSYILSSVDKWIQFFKVTAWWPNNDSALRPNNETIATYRKYEIYAIVRILRLNPTDNTFEQKTIYVALKKIHLNASQYKAVESISF
jgi:hypothetical protein